MRPLLCLLALTSLATAAETTPPPHALRDDWTALLATGCDLAAHRVRTPIEASVLRNTPYAVAGYTFKNTQLRALFRADGRWYAPKTSVPPTLGPKAVACVRRLKALEAAMKAQAGDTIAFKRAALTSRRAYWDVRTHSRAMKGGASSLHRGSTSLDVLCPDCVDLRFYTLACPVHPTSCEVNVPGTGDIPE